MELDTVFGIGICFGLALFFTAYTFKTLNSFLIWLAVFLSFCVYSGILPLWILILDLLVVIITVFLKFRKNSNGGI